jgi:hypothetical protein
LESYIFTFESKAVKGRLQAGQLKASTSRLLDLAPGFLRVFGRSVFDPIRLQEG